MDSDDPSTVRQRLELLRIEHQLAVAIGLDADPEYMADLEHQLEIWEAAWVGAAVTQLAVRRAELRGRPQG
jgi:DnaJ-domain-containing protein 1